MGERLFKVLGEDRDARMGTGKWFARKWMPPINGELIPCENGYHLCREQDLVGWLGPRIFEAKYRGERIDTNAKIVVREARLVKEYKTWNERTARLFACDCAERALGRVASPDKRSIEAVKIARRFAEGDATRGELSTAEYAARDAAWSTAESVAEYAARYAAVSATESATESAAWFAAKSAAWFAAWYTTESAAWCAAGYAEHKWQTKRLLMYLDGEII